VAALLALGEISILGNMPAPAPGQYHSFRCPARFAGGAFSFQNRLGWRLSSVKELKAKAKEPTRAGAI